LRSRGSKGHIGTLQAKPRSGLANFPATAVRFKSVPARLKAVTAKLTAISRGFTAILAMLKAKASRSKAIPVNLPATAVWSCRISTGMAGYSKRIERVIVVYKLLKIKCNKKFIGTPPAVHGGGLVVSGLKKRRITGLFMLRRR
jgi:hypothetical protein